MKNSERIFGVMTYQEMMQLRNAYVSGVRTDETKQANSLYTRAVRRGWTKLLKDQNKKEKNNAST